MPITMRPDGTMTFDTADEALDFWLKRQAAQTPKPPKQRLSPSPATPQNVQGFLSGLDKDARKVVIAIAAKEGGLSTDEICNSAGIKSTHLPGISRHIRAASKDSLSAPDGILTSEKTIIDRKPKTVYKIADQTVRERLLEIARKEWPNLVDG